MQNNSNGNVFTVCPDICESIFLLVGCNIGLNVIISLIYSGLLYVDAGTENFCIQLQEKEKYISTLK